MFENLDLELIAAWVGNHPSLAPVVVFLVTFSESLAFIGLFMPGAVLMAMIGALVALGVLDLVPVLVWAVAGAFAGDGVSYLLGWKLQGRSAEIWPFSRHPGWFQRGESFFYRYGVFSVVLARFVGPVRPIVPLVAGVLGMRPGLFYLTNGLSALVWAPLYLAPGYLLGSSLTSLSISGTKLVLGVILVGVIGWMTWRLRFGWRRFWDV